MNQQQFGLMRVHRCKTPGFWFWVWSLLIKRALNVKCLYRCACGNVFRYSLMDDWEPTKLNEWKELGGEE